jgi:hypothetical protein
MLTSAASTTVPTLAGCGARAGTAHETGGAPRRVGEELAQPAPTPPEAGDIDDLDLLGEDLPAVSLTLSTRRRVG